MMPARQQFYLDKVIVRGRRDEAVMQHGFLRVLHFLVVGIGFVLLLIAHYPVGQRVLLLFGAVFHDSPVRLVDVSETEHIVEACQSLTGLCENDESAYGAVKAMHHAEEDVAGFLVFLLDILLHRFGERSVAGLVALDYFAGGLADDDDMVVFVNYLHSGWGFGRARTVKKEL